jgi:cytochrome P450
VVDLADAAGDGLHAFLRRAADAGPLATEESTGGVVVLRHADIERLAHDHRLAGVGLGLFDLTGIGDGPLRRWYGGLMFTNEGETHQRLRSLVARAFTPRSVQRLRDEAAALASASLRPIDAAGGGDLIAALSLVPIRVMCRLLGVPDDDVAVFGQWADDLSPVFGIMEPEQAQAADRAIMAMLGYVSELADRRRAEPRDDLVSGLLAAEDDGNRLSHGEVLAMVANLLVGGHDTTASQIGCTLLTLVRHPDELARLTDEPELVASAVGESIRFEPSIGFVPRTAIEAVEVAGTELPPGTMVLLATAAANREPGIWKEPDRFDVTRFRDPAAPRLLSFGAGPHYCLGANLARMTVEETVRGVLALGPLEPAIDPWTVEWRQVLGRAPATLPVHLA